MDELHWEIEAQEKGQRFARHWTRDHVTADDDLGNVRAANVLEHRLKRRQVGVDVIQGSDSHFDASSLFEEFLSA